MRIIFFTLFSLLFGLSTFAQFHYRVLSEPSGAEVYLNGEKQGNTPLKVKYWWREAVDDKIVISVRLDGFKDWADTIREKPLSYNDYILIDMNKAFKVFDLKDNENLISFDKLIAEFKDDEVVGKTVDFKGNVEEIKWSGSIKVGDEIFEKKFYKFLTDMGYKSTITEEVKLFSNEGRSRPKLPRFTVGVEIIDYNIDYKAVKNKESKRKEIEGVNNIEYKWSVLDRSTGEVALIYKNRGIYKFTSGIYEETNQNLESYELALIDFFESDEFYNLVTQSGITSIRTSLIDKSDEEKVNTIKKVEALKFDKQSEMIRQANKSCVTIITDGGHGSGVIISEEGYLLTAYHVIEGVNIIEVKFSSGLKLKATLIEYDKFNDLALLDIQGEGFPALPIIAEKDEIALGEEVLTIGTPAELELGQSISKGIVSGKRKIEDRIYIQSDISVSPGNSGGPLINMKGEVIGIVQRKIIGEGIEGIGFSIPMDTIREILSLEEK